MAGKITYFRYKIRLHSIELKYFLVSDKGIHYFKFQERGYIGLCLLLYVIATIISFVSWGASAVSKPQIYHLFWLQELYKCKILYISILTITHLIVFQIFAYILVVLYVFHGMLRWKLYRDSLATPPPADIHTWFEKRAVQQ